MSSHFRVEKPIKLEVYGSSDLNATLEKATNLAKELKTIIYFEFNGENNLVFPDGYHTAHPALEYFEIK